MGFGAHAAAEVGADAEGSVGTAGATVAAGGAGSEVRARAVKDVSTPAAAGAK